MKTIEPFIAPARIAARLALPVLSRILAVLTHLAQESPFRNTSLIAPATPEARSGTADRVHARQSQRRVRQGSQRLAGCQPHPCASAPEDGGVPPHESHTTTVTLGSTMPGGRSRPHSHWRPHVNHLSFALLFALVGTGTSQWSPILAPVHAARAVDVRLTTSTIQVPASDPQRTRTAATAPTINGVCLDRSASYNPSAALREAQHTVGTDVANIPRATSSPGHLVYVWTISNNTYATRELRLTANIPDVPSKPTAPDPSLVSQDDTLQKLVAYQHDMRAYRVQLAGARAAATRYGQVVQALQLPREAKGSDIWGCLQRASEARVATLTIASDLDFNGVQQKAHPSLRHVTVKVIDFLCDAARVCASRKAYWQRTFAVAGTTNVHFFFPGQPVGDLFGA